MYIVAVLRDRLYCRVERSVLTVINEYVMLCYVMLWAQWHFYNMITRWSSPEILRRVLLERVILGYFVLEKGYLPPSQKPVRGDYS